MDEGKSRVRLSCQDQELEITEANLIASGGINAVIAEFTFSSHWNGFLKTMVCYQNKKDVYQKILENDSCVIPWEVMGKRGTLFIGVYGVKGEVTRSTSFVKMRITEGAFSDETEPKEPSQGVYDQLLRFYHIGENGNWWVGNVDTGTSAKGSGTTPVKGVDYWTEDDLAEMRKTIREEVQTQVGDELSGLKKDVADLQYVPIQITHISNNIGIVEMGTKVSSVAINIRCNKKMTELHINGESQESAEGESHWNGVQAREITSDTIFDVVVIDERGAQNRATTAVKFLNGVYFGAASVGTKITSDVILKMEKRLQASRTLSFLVSANNQRPTYAIPARYGVPVFKIGGFEYEWEKVATIDFKNASGYTESYDVWMHSQDMTGQITISVT